MAGLSALVIALAVACTPIRELDRTGDGRFAENQAVEVIAAGLNGVTEKYIHPVAVEDIAIEGMR
ncbi:MAG: hypothetical protein ACE5GT_10055, partial [Rhodospirillales bacterium]